MFCIVIEITINQTNRIIAIAKEENQTIYIRKTTTINIKQQNKIIPSSIIVIDKISIRASVPKTYPTLIDKLIV